MKILESEGDYLFGNKMEKDDVGETSEQSECQEPIMNAKYQVEHSPKAGRVSMHGLIEDTFIANIQKLGKVKRSLYQCSRECNQFSGQYHESTKSRKQTARIIEALGLNPM